MEPPSEDKQWATKYLLDPLNAPEPYEEAGGAFAPPRYSSTMKAPMVNSSAKSQATASSSGYPTPPSSASPTQGSFHPTNPYSAHRSLAFGDGSSSSDKGKGRRRGSSLTERFPGDMSHRPLDQIRRETKAAHRSPHLKKQHLPGADTIDVLDRSVFGNAYHHEGPYDATLLARNTSVESSPVAAVKETNEAAIKATPKEYLKDSLNKHVPLQGTSIIPPGMEGLDGRKMSYDEGADLMREEDAPGGAYKRWDGVKYLPEDYKGKGEPSFTIEKALKESKSSQRRFMSDNHPDTYEMSSGANNNLRPPSSRQRSVSGSNAELARGNGKASGNETSRFLGMVGEEGGVRRSNTTGRRTGEGLRGQVKRRFGSLRRSIKGGDI